MSLKKTVGVLILCAKPEEKQQIISITEQYFLRESAITEGFPTYNLPGVDDAPEESLVLADCIQMGNVSAASRTGYLLTASRPNLTIFVGTAGSLDPDKCKIFDVVIPTLGVITNYYDKLADAGEKTFSVRNRSFVTWGKLPENNFGLGAYTNDKKHYTLRKIEKNFELVGVGSSYVSEAVAAAAANANPLQDKLHKQTNGNNPTLHQDAYIFSWEKVLASDHYRQLLKKNLNSKALAVDMESYGFLSAFHQFNQLPYGSDRSSLIVRGISDICSDKNTSHEEGRNDKAVQNAAHIACRIIQDGYLKI